MEITKAEKGGGTSLVLDGRLDTGTAPKLQDMLVAELDAGKCVTLDFAGVAYVSSAGLRVLLMGEKAAKKNAVSQILINVSDEIMEVFEMTGFAAILKIEKK
jgi:anti-anti-sigma factor